nr:hypothetical protein [uncultured Pseudomonas sp.]
MKMPPLRLQHWLIFAAVALLFFSWGVWLMRGMGPAEPWPGFDELRTEVLAPLADDRLSLEQLHERLGGELWMQPRPEGPRLLFRGAWPIDDGESWLLEAELALGQAERTSLAGVFGVVGQQAEEPLGEQMLAQLSRHQIISLTLRPEQDEAPAARLASSIGQPRLRLELAEGQAWVYPELGLTAHLRDEQLRLLQVVPREALKR